MSSNSISKTIHFFPFLRAVCLPAVLLSFTLAGCATPPKTYQGTSRLIQAPFAESAASKIGSDLAEYTPLEESSEKALEEESLTQELLATAFTQIGRPYKYGGTSPKTGFDCAGFVQWVFSQHNIEVPRTTKGLITFGKQVKKEDLRPGDLVFYWRNRSRSLRHVGIYTGNGLFLHSPQTGDVVKETEAFDSYRRSRFICARRIVDDPNAMALAPDRKEDIIAAAAAIRKKKPTTVRLASRSRTYQVRKGDTIWSLAKRFGVSSRTILEANNLHARHTLRVGQTLAIP